MPLIDSIKPHAITVPRPLFQGQPPNFDTHQYIRQTFAPIMKVRLTYDFAQVNQYFIAGHPNDSLRFPAMHPLYPEERYHWFIAANDARGPFQLGPEVASWMDRPEVVKFGYLRDPDSIKPPTYDEKAEYEREHLAYVLAMRAKCARFGELVAKQAHGGLSSGEQQELEQLRAEVT